MYLTFEHFRGPLIFFANQRSLHKQTTESSVHIINIKQTESWEPMPFYEIKLNYLVLLCTRLACFLNGTSSNLLNGHPRFQGNFSTVIKFSLHRHHLFDVAVMIEIVSQLDTNTSVSFVVIKWSLYRHEGSVQRRSL